MCREQSNHQRLMRGLPLPLSLVPERFSHRWCGALLLRCVTRVTALQTALVCCSVGPERSWEIAPSGVGQVPNTLLRNELDQIVVLKSCCTAVPCGFSRAGAKKRLASNTQ